MTFQPIAGGRAFVIDNEHGPYDWLTPAIAAIANHDQDFAMRILTLRRSELHFIGLCVALMGDKALDDLHLNTFARAYPVMARKTLISAFSSVDVDGAIVKLVPKLAGAPWRACSYRRLVDLFAETAARKVLRHLPMITRRHVLTLGRLPVAFRTSGVLKVIATPQDLGQLLFAIEIVRRVRTDLDDRQILASLEKVKPHGVRTWVMNHYEQVPFPPAPTEALIRDGADILRPLTGYADLKRAALEFKNCIRTYLWGVLSGESYFYRYAPRRGQKAVAIVELRKVPVIGWVVHEALGPDNDAISSADRAIILSAFADVGIGAAPQAINPKGPWFELGGYYD